jgi:hypothetical protein
VRPTRRVRGPLGAGPSRAGNGKLAGLVRRALRGPTWPSRARIFGGVEASFFRRAATQRLQTLVSQTKVYDRESHYVEEFREERILAPATVVSDNAHMYGSV